MRVVVVVARNFAWFMAGKSLPHLPPQVNQPGISRPISENGFFALFVLLLDRLAAGFAFRRVVDFVADRPDLVAGLADLRATFLVAALARFAAVVVFRAVVRFAMIDHSL